MEQSVDTTLRFGGLKSGVYEYDYNLNKSFFDGFKNEDLTDGEVCFHLVMEKDDRLITLHFNYHGEVQTVCDRCLGNLTIPIDGSAMLIVKESNTELSENEDVVIVPENENKIDLAQWMYEYVVLAMPMRHVHPDDENGLPTCDPQMMNFLSINNEEAEESTDDDIDPRWDALKQLRM